MSFLLRPSTRQHEREELAGGVERGKVLAGLGRRADADDAVVPLVPVPELALDAGEDLRIGIDGKDDRRPHGPLIVVGAGRRA